MIAILHNREKYVLKMCKRNQKKKEKIVTSYNNGVKMINYSIEQHEQVRELIEESESTKDSFMLTLDEIEANLNCYTNRQEPELQSIEQVNNER